jgi:hypothetical protein
MSNTTGPLMITNHPYYPLEVEIASYLANEYSVPFLLGVFFSLCAGIVAFTRGWVRNFYPGLPGREKAAIWWFVICMSQSPVRGEYISMRANSWDIAGAIHLFFEGM